MGNRGDSEVSRLKNIVAHRDSNDLTVEERMTDLASFMHNYNMRGQHTPDRALTRYKHDVGKMVENNEISTGPGRWALGVPNAYGNAAYVPNVTTINQKWGASHIMTSTKTDVESNLTNRGRPTARTTCGQYQPEQGLLLAQQLTAMPEADFPQTMTSLTDPRCTLRGTGINRWEWLCENPQENVMVPFEYLVDSRHASKDAIYTQVTQPIIASPLVRDREFICGSVFVEQAVPIAKPRGPKDPQNFNDAVPGASQRVGSTPVARETPRGGPPTTGKRNSDAPPSNPRGYVDYERAKTGILAPPPPFSDYIAPH